MEEEVKRARDAWTQMSEMNPSARAKRALLDLLGRCAELEKLLGLREKQISSLVMRAICSKAVELEEGSEQGASERLYAQTERQLAQEPVHGIDMLPEALAEDAPPLGRTCGLRNNETPRAGSPTSRPSTNSAQRRVGTTAAWERPTDKRQDAASATKALEPNQTEASASKPPRSELSTPGLAGDVRRPMTSGGVLNSGSLAMLPALSKKKRMVRSASMRTMPRSLDLKPIPPTNQLCITPTLGGCTAHNDTIESLQLSQPQTGAVFFTRADKPMHSCALPLERHLPSAAVALHESVEQRMRALSPLLAAEETT
uniref:Uncharacterized protein n=1 Tax=Calcidiscus leptoporus TaxID=127549 RepID=A0A7S0JLK2_9EUKA